MAQHDAVDVRARVLLMSAEALESPVACGACGFVLKERLAAVDLDTCFTRSV